MALANPDPRLLSSQLAEAWGDREALVCHQVAGDSVNSELMVSLSYQQLHLQVQKAKSELQSRGIKSEDRVIVLTQPNIEFYVLLLACLELGAVLVPLNWRESFRYLAEQIHLINPALILKGNGQLGEPLGELFRHPRKESQKKSEEYDEQPWFLLATSGTTGKPKLVAYTLDMVWYNFLHTKPIVDLNESTISATLLPVHHTAGINLYALPTLFAGGKVVVYNEFKPETVLQDIHQRVFNTLLVVPTVYQKLLDHPNFQSTEFSGMRSLASGGAPLPAGIYQRFAQSKQFVVQNGCGMTETGPALFFQTRDEAALATDHALNCVGQPGAHWQVVLRDLAGQDVEPGQVGQIWVKGPGLTPGYCQIIDNQIQVFPASDHQGWYATGDLAVQEKDGQFRIVDRVKEIFICGGENVFPGEVEKVLLEHPGVKEAIVMGVPDQTWGEVGMAWVLPEHHGEPLDETGLMDHCRKNLAAFKVPAKIVQVQDFPRTASGKVIKRQLKQ